MSRKITTEKYKKQIKNKNVICLEKYINRQTPILHKCKKCKYEWKARPCNIKKGTKCPACSKIMKIKKMTLTNEQYIKQIKNKSLLSLEQYKGDKVKILHKCKKCDYEWKIRPNAVKQGQACPICAGNYPLSTEEYKIQINNSGIICIDEYINDTTKILHKCKKCNYEWNVKPNQIKQGHGCPICSKNKSAYGRYKNKPTILYYIFIPELNVYKIGLTQSSVKTRFKYGDFEVEILDEVLFEDGYQAYLLEQGVIEENKEHLWQPLNEKRFIGWTECFVKDIL